ncbi:hypothetical protein VTO73DRAFT_4418 [Trametes versicolor]
MSDHGPPQNRLVLTEYVSLPLGLNRTRAPGPRATFAHARCTSRVPTNDFRAKRLSLRLCSSNQLSRIHRPPSPVTMACFVMFRNRDVPNQTPQLGTIACRREKIRVYQIKSLRALPYINSVVHAPTECPTWQPLAARENLGLSWECACCCLKDTACALFPRTYMAPYAPTFGASLAPYRMASLGTTLLIGPEASVPRSF